MKRLPERNGTGNQNGSPSRETTINTRPYDFEGPRGTDNNHCRRWNGRFQQKYRECKSAFPRKGKRN
ncbi:unnamed protein product [Clavelina lepadiformis]|uniref:Uncharacterized protein n=1 Tax=Clavelina lepadiformis TaxID=159417 RepID=A0ABP0EZU0_CLALP